MAVLATRSAQTFDRHPGERPPPGDRRAGSAGTGIAGQAVRAMVVAGLSEDDAVRRCWLVDRDGLLHDRMEGMASFQQPFARPWSEISGWDDDADGVDRPTVLPLSNPTPRAEAVPADVLAWTDGAALVGTGSPFAPVTAGDRTVPIAQVNDVYVLPGVGLGVVAVKARAVSDEMLTAAATAIGRLAAENLDGALLPPITECRRVARQVAVAVATTAVREGLAESMTDGEIAERIEQAGWSPVYRHLTDS